MSHSSSSSWRWASCFFEGAPAGALTAFGSFDDGLLIFPLGEFRKNRRDEREWNHEPKYKEQNLGCMNLDEDSPDEPKINWKIGQTHDQRHHFDFHLSLLFDAIFESFLQSLPCAFEIAIVVRGGNARSK